MKKESMIKLMNDFYEQKVIKEGFHFSEVSEELLAQMQEAGMATPKRSQKKFLLEKYKDILSDDGYHGIVCKYSWRDYQNKAPKELLPYLKEQNMGDYTVVTLSDYEEREWE